tara:strand:+ start:785 stop:1750 length:966 start_codon:yes stop_codon:yes gene_type:complete
MAKEREITLYKESCSDQSILNILNTDSQSQPTKTKSTILRDALTKRKGTLSVLVEYKRNLSFQKKLEKGYVQEIFPPAIMSPVFRDFGATAVSVLADQNLGGCDYEDIVEFATEQKLAQGNVPGPLPIVSSDLIVDEIQVARAWVSGASGVCIDFDVLSVERGVELVKFATATGGEAIATASAGLLSGGLSGGLSDGSEAFVETVVAAGATLILARVNMEDEEECARIRENVPEDVCLLAYIKAYDDKDLKEVQDSWKLRDMGYKAVWVSDCLFKGGADMTEHCGAIIKSMSAKTSLKFGSVGAKSGRGEGSREYLGDIMM